MCQFSLDTPQQVNRDGPAAIKQARELFDHTYGRQDRETRKSVDEYLSALFDHLGEDAFGPPAEMAACAAAYHDLLGQ